jgi:hypothetical protein
MADERIIQFPKVTALAKNDYIVALSGGKNVIIQRENLFKNIIVPSTTIGDGGIMDGSVSSVIISADVTLANKNVYLPLASANPGLVLFIINSGVNGDNGLVINTQNNEDIYSRKYQGSSPVKYVVMGKSTGGFIIASDGTSWHVIASYL